MRHLVDHPGLDRAGGMFRMGIIVGSELPRDRSTLLVRFLAEGTLPPARMGYPRPRWRWISPG